jgi:hypothetical protein
MVSNEDFLKNGGRILLPFLKDCQNSISYWREYYSMDSLQESALEKIFKIRMAEKREVISLRFSDFAIFDGADEGGFDASIESFRELRIVFK